MDTILAGIISGAAVLFIGSLAWIAYNHPEIFDIVNKVVGVVTLCAICWAFGYNMGVFAAVDAVPDSWGKLRLVLLPNYWTYIFVGFIAYMMLLANVVVRWKGRDTNAGHRGNKQKPPSKR